MKKYVFIIAGIVLAFLAYFGINIYNAYHRVYIPQKTKTVKNKPAKPKHVFNILLLGYGGQGHDGAYLTDTIMLFHVDTEKKKAVLISIPRDIWVKVKTKSGDDFHFKINALFQSGLDEKNYPDIVFHGSGFEAGFILLRDAVYQMTGQKADNFVAVDFSGFEKAIDMLGGVKINVEKTFDDYEYPITGKEKDLCGKDESELPELEKIATKSPVVAFPCRYEHLHFDKGVQIMNGERSLKYVRSRHSLQDGSDFGRARRQQLLLEAVKDRILSVGFIPKIIPLINELSRHIKTDISITDMKKFIEKFKDADKYQLRTVVLSSSNYLQESFSPYGGFILIPKDGLDNWKNIKMEISQFLTKPASPSASLKPSLGDE